MMTGLASSLPMNVLLIGRSHTESFATHIADSLEQLGHNCYLFEPGVRYGEVNSSFGRKWSQAKALLFEISQKIECGREFEKRKLLQYVENKPIDLTIVCHDFLPPETVRALKKSTAGPVVMWFPDHISRFDKSYFLCSGYDALFFKDPYIVLTLSNMLNKKVFYLPECFNGRSLGTTEFSSDELDAYRCDISTAGNMYPYRRAVFEQLSDYHVKIWGNPAPRWMKSGRLDKMMQNHFVADTEKMKAFRASSIVLNSLHPAEIWGVNARAFEIAGAGGFQLIDCRPGLHQLFEVDKEVVAFSSMKNLISKINYYLDKPELRRTIAAAGLERAHKEHTYDHRISLLIDTVFGLSNGYPLPDIAYV
jgi:spore maturation protein CgeB